MARRRYISTEISIDKEVNKLALQYGDFAALLYTWMIPHAEDNCLITADPFELLNKLVPGRRDKTEDDVQVAIDGMLKLKLITLSEDCKMLKFKPKTFYKYQSYINEKKRQFDENVDTSTITHYLHENDEETSLKTGQVFQFYQKNIGQITQFHSEVLLQYLDEGMEPEMIIAVMQDGIGKDNPWAWIKKVLANSDKNNIRTAEQYEAKKIEREKANTKKDSKPKGNKNPKSDFNNFQNRKYDGEKLQEVLLNKSREELNPEYEQREGESIEAWQKRILAMRNKDPEGKA
jgi:DnaD/phage-associated family protein